MSASAGLRAIEVSRSSSPPAADDHEAAVAASASGAAGGGSSGISEADPEYSCRTPTSEGSRLPPAPLNCPPPPRKRKWRRRPRPRQVLELVTVEAEELEQLFQPTPHAKRVKVQDSDRAD